jgi:hypothetical protein
VGVKGGDAGPDVPALGVRFPPIWSHIAPLATYIGALLEVQKRADAAERVAIVAHELLENAVKYGDPASEVKLDVFTAPGQSVVIRVTNRAHPSRVAILERELHRNRATTPQEAFTRAFERLQHLPEGSTMLGLARVALEANLRIETTSGLVVATATIDGSGTRSTSHNPNKGVGQAGRNEAGPESRAFQRPGSNISQTRRVDGAKPDSSQSSPAMGAVGNTDPNRGTNRR